MTGSVRTQNTRYYSPPIRSRPVKAVSIVKVDLRFEPLQFWFAELYSEF